MISVSMTLTSSEFPHTLALHIHQPPDFPSFASLDTNTVQQITQLLLKYHPLSFKIYYLHTHPQKKLELCSLVLKIVCPSPILIHLLNSLSVTSKVQTLSLISRMDFIKATNNIIENVKNTPCIVHHLLTEKET